MLTGDDLKRRNIEQWEGHCEKLEKRKKDLTAAEKDDLEFRRLQINRWRAELGEQA